MIKNYFYLIVGLLCVLFAVTHTWSGLHGILPILAETEIDGRSNNIFIYVWHVIGIENLIMGIALVIMAFQKNMEKVRFTAWVIIAILAMRWIVIALTTVLNRSSVGDLLPDTIAIFTVVALLLSGTRVKSKT